MCDTVIYTKTRYVSAGTSAALVPSMTTTQKANLEAARTALLAAAAAYRKAYEACEVAPMTDESREVLALDASDLDFQCAALLDNAGPLFELDK